MDCCGRSKLEPAFSPTRPTERGSLSEPEEASHGPRSSTQTRADCSSAWPPPASSSVVSAKLARLRAGLNSLAVVMPCSLDGVGFEHQTGVLSGPQKRQNIVGTE